MARDVNTESGQGNAMLRVADLNCGATGTYPAAPMPVRKLILFVGLSVADLGLTWHLLSHADGQVYEGNPLARWWLARYGWQGLTCFKLALAVLVVGLTLVIARQRPRAAARVLVFSCAILAAVVLYSGLLVGAVAARSVAPGLLDDPEVAAVSDRSQDLDQQLQQAEAYHRLLERLSADLLARRRTLPEAGGLLAASDQGRNRDWLRELGRVYPGRSEQARLAANLVYCALRRLRGGSPAEEETARRLAADYRACYGVAFTLPDDTAEWRAAGEGAAGGS
jgi:hypothetical protein